MADVPVLYSVLTPSRFRRAWRRPSARWPAAARAAGLGASLAGGQQGFGTFPYPYDAASWSSPEMGEWLPTIRSPDQEINLYRDRMVARQRDLYRNDGWAKGAIGSILDSTIGAQYRLIAKPDWRRLALYDKAFDAVWAREFRQVRRGAVARLRRGPRPLQRRHAPADRGAAVPPLPRPQADRRREPAAALLAAGPHRPRRGQVRHRLPRRRSGPAVEPLPGSDTRYMRGGVEIDDLACADSPTTSARPSRTTTTTPSRACSGSGCRARTSDGFVRVIHDFDRERFGSIAASRSSRPILSRMKMLARYYGVELQAATVASVFGTFITSPFDSEMVQEALTGPGGQAGLNTYQDLRTAFHDKHKLQLNGVRIPTLAPGEKIETVSAAGRTTASAPSPTRCCAASPPPPASRDPGAQGPLLGQLLLDPRRPGRGREDLPPPLPRVRPEHRDAGLRLPDARADGARRAAAAARRPRSWKRARPTRAAAGWARRRLGRSGGRTPGRRPGPRRRALDPRGRVRPPGPTTRRCSTSAPTSWR
jgi:hypothetical protein